MLPHASLLELTGPLMSMIVLPYLGVAAARGELARPTPERHAKPRVGSADPPRDLDMRLTYRTVRVLMAVAELGGAGSHPSNREVGATAGMTDQGQTSKLLSRLHRLGLIENTGVGPSKGAPTHGFTPKGAEASEHSHDRAPLNPSADSPRTHIVPRRVQDLVVCVPTVRVRRLRYAALARALDCPLLTTDVPRDALHRSASLS